MRIFLTFVAISLLPWLNALAASNRHLAAAASQNSVLEGNAPTRIIVQRRFDKGIQSGPEIGDELRSIAPQLRKTLRNAANDMEVWLADSALDSVTTQRVLKSLQQRRDVQFAAVDRRRHAHALPSDVLFSNQWYLQSTQPAAIAADAAWDLTTGSANVVVAILDTGVRFDHPDLAGKLLPGHDFVSADSNGGFLAANDGDGWDADASDPGDWISSSDKQKPIFKDCTIDNSSWHGTRVAGMIGANTDNAIGIAGAGWRTMILPVRVLGKCGGYDSDIFAAMKWAAGMHVAGVPDNPTPAKIINLSLGSSGLPCSSGYQSVVQQLSALGVLIVVSAGNEGGPVDEPANCPGVIGVAGLRHAGTKVGYSSLGPEISIAAPAGNCANLSGACLFSLDTTYNTGATVPSSLSYTDQFNTNLGTSFSAPLAAAVAALMRAVNAQLSPSQLRARMLEGAVAFPPPGGGIPLCHVPIGNNDIQSGECGCTTSTCGVGMLNARNAVAAALRPIASVIAPTSFATGSAITLDGSTSVAACSRSIKSYAWTLVSSSGTPPTLTNTTQSQIIINAPVSGSFTLRLTVTDDQNAIDTGDVVVNPNSATSFAAYTSSAAACPGATPPPPPTPQTPASATPEPASTGGGGGSFACNSLLPIVLVLALLHYLRRRKHIKI